MRRPSRSAVAVALFAMLAGGGLSACSSTHSADTYSRGELGKPMSLQRGWVLSVRAVKVEGNTYGAGMAAGAVMGGAGGSLAGGGSGNETVKVIGAVGGAVLGGLLGMLIEQGVTTDSATEVIVQLDSGKTQAYVEKIEDPLAPGDRVIVMNSDLVRIIKDTSGVPPVAPVMTPTAPLTAPPAAPVEEPQTPVNLGPASEELWSEPPQGAIQIRDAREGDGAGS